MSKNVISGDHKVEQNMMNLFKTQQSIKTLQSTLTDFLNLSLCDTYELCSENSIIDKSSKNIYSPFLLALIGIILLPMRNNKNIDILAKRIYEKLSVTENSDGLFNFYGNKKYFYDVDTTAVVNTFLFDYCQIIPNKIKTIQLLLNNKSDAGSIHTWIGKENNNIDWFVNFNVYIFLKKHGYHENRLTYYLKNNIENFYNHGSRYYKNITIPLFMMYLYIDQKHIDDNDFIITKYFNFNENILNNNMILSGITFLCKNKKNMTECDDLLQLINENWNHKVQCFNSSKAFYTSTELNAAISLYLLNKMGALENE
ncbi:MAG: hypothetical protein WCI11_11285 [Candidatus Methylumidiphilus sp.]